jgi:glutathione S-transferase
MLELYGNARSRAMRCLWMLEEVGQPYRLVEKSVRADDLQTAEYLALNPNARIPTLVDGGRVLWESMAINLYLALKYDGPMHAGPEVSGSAPNSCSASRCASWTKRCRGRSTSRASTSPSPISTSRGYWPGERWRSSIWHRIRT